MSFPILFPRRTSCSNFLMPQKKPPRQKSGATFDVLLFFEDTLNFLSDESEDEEYSLEETIEEVVRCRIEIHLEVTLIADSVAVVVNVTGCLNGFKLL